MQSNIMFSSKVMTGIDHSGPLFATHTHTHTHTLAAFYNRIGFKSCAAFVVFYSTDFQPPSRQRGGFSLLPACPRWGTDN